MELLKDSQYLNPNLDMGSLTVTISGALGIIAKRHREGGGGFITYI